MYTVILMAAMTSGSATTGQWLGHRGCPGTAYSCRGCYGCWGGYPGSGYNYMVANGYQSAFSVYAPVAGAGASGAGAYGAGALGCGGSYGCYGGLSCYGVPLPHHGTGSTPVPEKSKIEETPPPREKIPAPKEPKKTDEQVRARLSIEVPAGGKLFVDGEPMNLAAGKHVFRTPELTAGRTYFYDLRLEIVRDGQTIAENQRVMLRPGQMVTAAFPKLNQDAPVVPVSNRQE